MWLSSKRYSNDFEYYSYILSNHILNFSTFTIEVCERNKLFAVRVKLAESQLSANLEIYRVAFNC